MGDYIQTMTGLFYRVQAVEEYGVLGSFAYRICNLTLDQFALSGHVESTPTVIDARKRTRTWIDTYLSLSVDWISCYDKPDYPIVRVFDDKGIEVIYSIGEITASPMMGFKNYPYGYTEEIPITMYCTNTQSYKGTTMKHAAEDALRTVANFYPIGSETLRELVRRRDVTERFGTVTLYGTEFTLKYTRDIT
jgi:hypothetical protein